ncbi:MULTISPECIES: H/ACA ribonucleoprotein complex subunit GAR1 [unclassified Archaeoglobus]|jgi:RNA-binding protein|uniref:H/ACA ribonucleoprotein complex subunit GAR1 n=1 Tax=unclassified Archaeoglobus TaxID=2643606 RepID=UPI0025BF8A48|nr:MULTISPECIES: H/ACA ribonucleoprotein complex subunit GAR1 [unclassified Archaeoglobus]
MKKLRALGKVKHMSKSGMLVVALNPAHLPKIGNKIVTRKMEYVGTINDIIGPVSSPYALVRPKNPEKIVFEDLFVVKEYGGGRKGKGEGSRKGSRKKGDRKRRGY